MRSQIDNILYSIHQQATSNLPPGESTLTWQPEPFVRIRANYNGVFTLVRGYPDYCLWYEAPSAMKKLIIKEAKERYEADKAEPQLLGYMSMYFSSTN